MWLRLLRTRYDNPLFVQARRSLRRRWWRSWVGPALALIVVFYGFLIVVQLGIGMGPAGAATGGMDAQALLRLFLLVMSPLIGLFSFMSGARTVQRERERGTLETLLLTDLNNQDLITGKILGALLPFVLLTAALVPAVAQFGTLDTADIPALFTKKWRFPDIFESVWYLPHWEMLMYIFLGSVLGVVYGVHRAAHYRRPSMIYSFGMVSFLLLIPFAILLISHLFTALMEIPIRLVYWIKTRGNLDFTPYEPFGRMMGGIVGAWLLTLIPLFDLADKFRYLCGEEQDPRYLLFRPRPSSMPKPVPWTEPRKPTTIQDIWAAEFEKRQEKQPRPGQALMPRDSRYRFRERRD